MFLLLFVFGLFGILIFLFRNKESHQFLLKNLGYFGIGESFSDKGFFAHPTDENDYTELQQMRLENQEQIMQLQSKIKRFNRRLKRTRDKVDELMKPKTELCVGELCLNAANELVPEPTLCMNGKCLYESDLQTLKKVIDPNNGELVFGNTVLNKDGLIVKKSSVTNNAICINDHCLKKNDIKKNN